jgi:hypothetical protein
VLVVRAAAACLPREIGGALPVAAADYQRRLAADGRLALLAGRGQGPGRVGAEDARRRQHLGRRISPSRSPKSLMVALPVSCHFVPSEP